MNKGELLKCVESLIGDDVVSTPSSDWVNIIDRGGLVHIKEATYYLLFCAMEEEVRVHFRMQKVEELTNHSKKHIEISILDNENVLFHWCILSAGVDDEDGGELLGMMVNSNIKFIG